MSESKYLIGPRSDFSIGESLLKPKRIVELAKERGYTHVGLADTMTVSGMIDFINGCKEHEMEYIIGCRLRVVMDLAYRPPSKSELRKPEANPEFYPKVWVKNSEGMKDLYKLLSLANEEDRFYFKPRISFDDLLGALSHGNLVLTTGDLSSVFATVENPRFRHRDIIAGIIGACGASQCVIELCDINTPLFKTANRRALSLSVEWNLATIDTRPVFYESDDQADTLDVLAVINTNGKMSQDWRNIQWVKDFSIDKAEEVSPPGRRLLFQACEYKWSKLDPSMPQMADDEFAALVALCKEGWRTRLTTPVMGYIPSEDQLPLYKERLSFELRTLKEMGFERYFLLVHHIVKWSKNSQINVGPGRGSVGGSLVAYLIGITDVDPIRFGLIFERFINPSRKDLPDADLDFMSTRREEVIDYIRGKWGDDCVANISNYATMASASAFRDCGRVHEMSNEDMTPTKFVPKEHGRSFGLEEAAEAVPEIMRMKDRFPNIWKHALNLEGVMRNLGQHAAGVVVAGEPLVNRAVIERRAKGRVVNWDRDTVENQGLVKMDILGLSTLDTLQIAVDLIKQRHSLVLDPLLIPLDDEKTLEAFRQGDAVGVFQFTSSGMRKLLKDMGAYESLTFMDLATATALYRPGPMDSGMLDEYVQIKQGVRTPHYEHPSMETDLGETYGVMVFQENVMRVAQSVAGYTMAEADTLRKVMGKKKREEMEKQREKFVNGCMETVGFSKQKAEALFEKIETFAAYGFNKSHSVAYTIISYWSMYLKIHYPAEFYAAALTVETDDTHLTQLVLDAQKHGIHVVPPDINRSSGRFEVYYSASHDETWLFTPFDKVKGVSVNGVDAILSAREKLGGRFESFDQFSSEVSARKCNSKAKEALRIVGAFAEIEPGTLPARHPDRLKEQMTLLPGLIVQAVKADRATEMTTPIKGMLSAVLHDCHSCDKCNLSGGRHPMPRMGKKISFMVITDCPSFHEDANERLLEGKSSETLKAYLKEAGLRIQDGYFTTLVKSIKTGKQLEAAQINACSDYLRREIEIVKPPIIVALGSAVCRYFAPDMKGGSLENAGKVVYDPKLDASIVFGINPGMAAFREEAETALMEIFGKVAEMVS